MRSPRRWLVALACVAGALAAGHALAVPLVPAADDEVVERLPAWRVGSRAAVPLDATAALAQARTLMRDARERGDPRPVGRAIALLAPFADGAAARPEVVLALAGALDYLHDFDGAMQRLRALVARDPAQPQARLMLATLERLKGRYDASDQQCRALLAAGAMLHGQACLAENLSLRGDSERARARLETLLPAARGDEPAWLLTSLAEMAERDGRDDDAERRWRQVLALAPDAYARLGLCDLLLRKGRGNEARALLAGQPDSDAALLRMAESADDETGRQAAATLRARFAQAALRPGAAVLHARERARLALHVDHDPVAALKWSLADLTLQREPADLVLLAEVARANSGAAAAQARQALQSALNESGLHDARIDRLR